MASERRSRVRAVRTLESATGREKPTGRTTAAATTGPANGPRPTSSTPAMQLKPRSRAAFSKAKRLVAEAVNGTRLVMLLVAAFFDAGGLADLVAQVVELGSAHATMAHDFDAGQTG